ncbi:MAG: DUF255 domain-containing protein [Opitutales bacterium]
MLFRNPFVVFLTAAACLPAPLSANLENRLADTAVAWAPTPEAALAASGEADLPVFLFLGTQTGTYTQAMLVDSFRNAEMVATLSERFASFGGNGLVWPGLATALDHYLWLNDDRAGPPWTFWLTPDAVPLAAGAYFPPAEEWGKPGLVNINNRVLSRWEEDRERAVSEAVHRFDALIPELRTGGAADEAIDPPEAYNRAVEAWLADGDPVYGGFGFAPKGLHPHRIRALIEGTGTDPEPRQTGLNALRTILDGAVYDPVDGGFFQASADDAWTLPVFGKYLADQSAMLRTLAVAYQVTGQPGYREAADSTVRFLESRLQGPTGLLHHGLAPRTAGEAEGTPEGDHYLWTWSDLETALGPDSDALALSVALFGADPAGNISEEADPLGDYAGRILVRGSISWRDAGEGLGWSPDRTTAAWQDLVAGLKALRAQRPVAVRDVTALASENAVAALALFTWAEVAPEASAAQARALAQGIIDALWHHLWDAEAGTLHLGVSGEQPLDREATLDGYAPLLAVACRRAEAAESGGHWARRANAIFEQLDGRFWNATVGQYAHTAEPALPGWPRIHTFREHRQPAAQTWLLETLPVLANRADAPPTLHLRLDKVRNAAGNVLLWAPEQYPALLMALLAD